MSSLNRILRWLIVEPTRTLRLYRYQMPGDYKHSQQLTDPSTAKALSRAGFRPFRRRLGRLWRLIAE